MTLRPLPADRTLESYYLDARCKLLEVAAILDRIDRGAEGEHVAESDPRYARLIKALAIIGDHCDADRAERVQNLFSLEYDPTWKRPTPR